MLIYSCWQKTRDAFREIASENISCCLDSITFEPPHVKTNKMTVCPAKTKISLGIRPVWSQPSLCAQWVVKDPSFLHADSEYSDQTWLIWSTLKTASTAKLVHLSITWMHTIFNSFFSRDMSNQISNQKTTCERSQVLLIQDHPDWSNNFSEKSPTFIPPTWLASLEMSDVILKGCIPQWS